jgi:tRNA-modifying protein YgfZ
MPVAHLDDRAVVRIAGPDAANLLQNVVTLDVQAADRHGSAYGALLTPQGKILWDFVLHRQPEGYAADVRADEGEAFAKRLSLYRLRAKVEIALAPDLAVYAEWPAPGENPADPRLAALGSRFVASRASVKTDAAAADWHRHRVALAVPEGGVDFVFGDTFPHDAAMDSLQGVAFDKGCYVGQEVVSRMRHRGTARRRILALAAAAPLPEPGTEITAGDRPVGRLGSSANGRAIGLARLDRLHAALREGLPLRAGSVELQAALPSWATYGWPAEAAMAED